MSGKEPPDLRGLFLHLSPTDLRLAPTDALPHVWAAMMEWKMAKGVVSLVTIIDGSTSLYFSMRRVRSSCASANRSRPVSGSSGDGDSVGCREAATRVATV